jgi:sterol O-acyltransferase
LNVDGIASLEADTTYTGATSNPPRSLKAALEAVGGSRRSISDTSSETASEEDYDALKHDPMAVVRGGRGGGFVAEDGTKTPELVTNGRSYEELKTRPSKSRPTPSRLRSMYVFMKLFDLSSDVSEAIYSDLLVEQLLTLSLM